MHFFVKISLSMMALCYSCRTIFFSLLLCMNQDEIVVTSFRGVQNHNSQIFRRYFGIRTTFSSKTYASSKTKLFEILNNHNIHNERISENNVNKPKAQIKTSLQSLKMPLSPVATSSTKTKKKNLKTFPRYLEVECWKREDLRGLESVLQAVADACKQITRIVQRAQTDDMYGVADGLDGCENIQGEIQQKLDVLCNTIMMRTFCGSSRDTIQLIASEEEEVPRCCSDVMVGFFVHRNDYDVVSLIQLFTTNSNLILVRRLGLFSKNNCRTIHYLRLVTFWQFLTQSMDQKISMQVSQSVQFSEFTRSLPAVVE